ncbi:MAG TPA: SIMPL domain-containing protein [Chloroflexi bacterium]|nr:SIMPL domain-containing protein [Chloroflexota bacterium]
MNTTVTQRVLAITLAAALLLTGAFAGGSWLQTPTVLAQEAATPTPSRTITVVGEGVVNIEPNVARTNIGVEVLRPTVEEAAAENTAIVERLLATLTELGIPGEDIQTSGYNVYAERYGASGPVSDEEVQYRVSNSVTVIIRNLDKVGEVLDASIKAGANNIYGVEFLLDDATAVRSEARKLAVENAKATAEELAALNGVKVGKILAISEVVGGAGGFYNNSISNFQIGMGGAERTPIQPGQLRLTMQLQLTYELVE